MAKLLRYSSVFILLLSFLISCSQSQGAKQDNTVQAISAKKQTNLDSLPEPVGRVNDFEGLFTSEQISSLDSLLNTFETKTTIQIAIVTVDTTAVAKEKFEDFTLRLANDWGVGQKDKNNGILIGISRGYRKIRIQNGKGIEKLVSNAETQIIVNEFIPGFKEGDYYKGTLNGVTKFINLLNTKLKQ
jgi:uncharacterized protein